VESDKVLYLTGTSTLFKASSSKYSGSAEGEPTNMFKLRANSLSERGPAMMMFKMKKKKISKMLAR